MFEILHNNYFYWDYTITIRPTDVQQIRFFPFLSLDLFIAAH